jgi:hypothetical protein
MYTKKVQRKKKKKKKEKREIEREKIRKASKPAQCGCKKLGKVFGRWRSLESYSEGDVSALQRTRQKDKVLVKAYWEGVTRQSGAGGEGVRTAVSDARVILTTWPRVRP